MHYGKRLTELIEWKGVDKKALALGIGVHRSRLNRQLGNPYPDMKLSLDILDYLGLRPEALFSDGETTPVQAEILQGVRGMPAGKQKALLDLIRTM